ncbi:MAG TPA: N-methyl-D-aspartate receptor NMDAR2C subunit [Spirochaetota bacterium]|nr:N-methyl-D-aspartate receptor NMDAR2C subunit [Spirochaetota bacterium]HNT12415.1 N-methyl-D-aspartate receptor NMDAR2C subunit [Spirochaetota bacterium]
MGDKVDDAHLGRRWLSLFPADADRAALGRAFESLIARYREPHRRYHAVSHLAHCLEQFDQIGSLAESPRALELALWHHDAIYRTTSFRNEERSARLAAATLSTLDPAGCETGVVRELIMLTKHDRVPPSVDGRFMVDIDLTILGAPDDAYRRYEEGVRREYGWVPGFLYRKMRSKLLGALLVRDRIYHSDYFHNRYEQAARANLAEEMGRLLRQ